MSRLTILLGFTLVLISVPFYVNAYETPHRTASVERIAGYSWYHWQRPGVDSCILWLGGGQLIPSYVTVNPYELESLNTMRFMEDLASQYGMLALKEGEIEYRVDTKLVSKVCKWIRDAGYTYAFVVGYSTGGIALAYELTIPEQDVPGPDGAVIISSMIDWEEMVEKHKVTRGIELYMSARNSQSVQRSVLLMYGEMAWFWRQGEQYYKNLPGEGWRSNQWFYKEWMLLKGTEHEVFTLEVDGSYDPKPFAIAVGFLERIRASSLKNAESVLPEKFRDYASNSTGKRLEVAYPSSVRTHTLFQVEAKIAPIGGVDHAKIAIYDLDGKSFVTMAEANLAKDTGYIMPVVCTANQSVRHLLAVAVSSDKDDVRFLAFSSPMNIEVTNNLRLSVETGTASLSIKIDEKTFTADNKGRLEAYLNAGNHTVLVPKIVAISQEERLVFTSWEDGNDKNPLIVSLRQDLTIKAKYGIQYLLTVNSEYGTIQGAGWYEANSTATVEVISDPDGRFGMEKSFFSGWSDDPKSRSLLRQIFVDAPKTVSARWNVVRDVDQPIWLFTAASTIFSFVTIIVYIVSLHRPKH